MSFTQLENKLKYVPRNCQGSTKHEGKRLKTQNDVFEAVEHFNQCIQKASSTPFIKFKHSFERVSKSITDFNSFETRSTQNVAKDQVSK